MNDIEETELNPDWFPTAQELIEYQARDLELAASNLHVILRASPRALFLREIRDSCLHNASTVNKALHLEFTAGRVSDDQGRFFSV